ncbi:MAG: hypothetical protein KGZ81_10440 [Flavobacteriales bacterium]|nr:hypothetical protein [Flavobacteriales bacterium]
MKSITYSQFWQNIRGISGIPQDNSPASKAAPYLAYVFVWLAMFWSSQLSALDLKIRPTHKPWIYGGLLVIFFAAILLPQIIPKNKSETAAPAWVMSLPLVPIEPTLVPDSLFIPFQLNQPHHEK